MAAGVAAETHGFGVDAVLLCAGSRDSGAVFEQVAALCRDRARVVVVGDVKMDISRRAYFEKELEIVQSRSYGPGRYDPAYEEKGQDYPIGYVRWTERRNMAAFLDLIADGRLDPTRLTTHHFPIDDAGKAYDLVSGKQTDFTVGIVLEYGTAAEAAPPAVVRKGVAAGKVGLGVIGTGRFAKGILLPALVETEGFELVGVASARGLSANAVRERYGARYAETDAERLIDDDAIDAVVIATRHDSHARYVIAALERGKHVFVEKPLCLDENELAAIEAAAARSTGTLMVGFNRRFSPMVGAIRDHFAGREEPMALMYRVNAGRIPIGSEKRLGTRPAVGGGRIVGEVCHFVDTLMALTGALPADVTAMGANPRRAGLAGNDIATITIRFEDGSIGTVHYWSNGDASYPKERIEVFCQEKIAILENFRRLGLVARNRAKSRRPFAQQKGFAEEARAFLDACRSGVPAIPMGELAAVSLTTFAAVAALNGAER